MSLSIPEDFLLKAAKKANDIDYRLNKKLEFVIGGASETLNAIIKNGVYKTGYRNSCGSTDRTLKVWREVNKYISFLNKELVKHGLKLIVNELSSDCRYATLAGGFWKDVIITLEEV